jgi:hypothetical protein
LTVENEINGQSFGETGRGIDCDIGETVQLEANNKFNICDVDILKTNASLTIQPNDNEILIAAPNLDLNGDVQIDENIDGNLDFRCASISNIANLEVNRISSKNKTSISMQNNVDLCFGNICNAGNLIVDQLHVGNANVCGKVCLLQGNIEGSGNISVHNNLYGNNNVKSEGNINLGGCLHVSNFGNKGDVLVYGNVTNRLETVTLASLPDGLVLSVDTSEPQCIGWKAAIFQAFTQVCVENTGFSEISGNILVPGGATKVVVSGCGGGGGGGGGGGKGGDGGSGGGTNLFIDFLLTGAQGGIGGGGGSGSGGGGAVRADGYIFNLNGATEISYILGRRGMGGSGGAAGANGANGQSGQFPPTNGANGATVGPGLGGMGGFPGGRFGTGGDGGGGGSGGQIGTNGTAGSQTSIKISGNTCLILSGGSAGRRGFPGQGGGGGGGSGSNQGNPSPNDGDGGDSSRSGGAGILIDGFVIGGGGAGGVGESAGSSAVSAAAGGGGLRGTGGSGGFGGIGGNNLGNSGQNGVNFRQGSGASSTQFFWVNPQAQSGGGGQGGAAAAAGAFSGGNGGGSFPTKGADAEFYGGGGGGGTGGGQFANFPDGFDGGNGGASFLNFKFI